MAALGFDDWKSRFRQNCEQRGKLVEFNCLGEYVLQVLWNSGLEPTVQALTNDQKKAPTVISQNVIQARSKA